MEYLKNNIYNIIIYLLFLIAILNILFIYKINNFRIIDNFDNTLSNNAVILSSNTTLSNIVLNANFQDKTAQWIWYSQTSNNIIEPYKYSLDYIYLYNSNNITQTINVSNNTQPSLFSNLFGSVLPRPQQPPPPLNNSQSFFTNFFNTSRQQQPPLSISSIQTNNNLNCLNKSTNATLYIIANDLCLVYFNMCFIGSCSNQGIIYNFPIRFIQGLNYLRLYVGNTGKSLGLICTVLDRNNNVLFNSNSSWKTINYGTINAQYLLN
jgi:hypothetical protein